MARMAASRPTQMVASKLVSLKSSHAGCHLVTDLIARSLSKELGSAQTGVVTLAVKHSPSVSLTVNENADPTVRTDIIAAMGKYVPDSMKQELASAGLLAVAHAKSFLFPRAIDLPFTQGRFSLGTWQGIYLCVWEQQSSDVELYAVVHGTGPAKPNTITVTEHRGCHEATTAVSGAMQSTLEAGSTAMGLLVNVSIKHTSASVTVGPSGKKRKGRDEVEDFLNQLVPERWNKDFFQHTYEGPDDMPGHLKSSLIGSSFTVPCTWRGGDASFDFGEGKDILMCEHRDSGGWGGGHNRKIGLVPLLPPQQHTITSITVPCSGLSAVDMTHSINQALGASGVAQCEVGVVNICVKDRSASVIVLPYQSACGAVPLVARQLPPGDSDAQAMVLGKTSLTLPISKGALCDGLGLVCLVNLARDGHSTTANVSVVAHAK